MSGETTWIRADEAAVLLGVSVSHVHVIAHRHGWRRCGSGRATRYTLDAALATLAARIERDKARRP